MNRSLKAVAALSFAIASFAIYATRAEDKTENRIFEMRTYYAAPGKMDALNARFRDHTCKFFKKHNITIVGFWTPTDPENAKQQLVYLLAFPNQEAAAKSWKNFRADPEWTAAKEASEKYGKIVEKIESVYLNPTDYSPLK